MKLPRIRGEALPWLVGLGLASLALFLLHPLFSLPALALFWFVAFFFRDPERRASVSPDAILSPADGRVLEIGEVDEPDFLEGRALRVGIFLSLLDVHINRSPIGGRVSYRKYQRGGFHPAFRPEAGVENERNAIGIQGDLGKALIVQVAGVLARRIVCWVSEDDQVEAGQRIGMIRFGSRTDLFLPKARAGLLVRSGDRVKAGKTIVGRWLP